MKLSLVFTIIFILASGCSNDDGSPAPASAPNPTPTPIKGVFSNPEKVTVMGYTGNSIMEPFISRDGAYLFFNDNEPIPMSTATEKDLHYATYVDDLTFQYQGAIAAINNAGFVEGVPTMDNANNFYFVSTANYSPPTMAYDTLYGGTWTGATVAGSALLTGLAIATPGAINYDLEISPDGNTLYFNDGMFSGNAFPDSGVLSIATNTGSGFVRDPNSAILTANINTSELEYAPAISADGLELLFTRLEISSLSARIYQSVRSSTNEPFGAPVVVSDITNFAEGPTFSPDEKSFYYHKRNDMTGRFELFRVSRP